MMDRGHPPITGREIPLDDPGLLDFLRLFHGHVGPFVVLGHRIGHEIRRRLGAEKYSGLEVRVVGPKATPYTCLIDGLQTGTGCTMGKGNITVGGGAAPPDVLFRLRFEGQSGALTVTIPLAVKELFAGWMAQGLAEGELFERVLGEPAEDLWSEAAS